MPPLPAPPRPLRRLLSALLALSVLLTALGLGHPSCEAAAGVRDAGLAPHASHAPHPHAAMATAPDEAPAGGEVAPPPRGCPDQGRHDGRGAAPCALAAHCAVGVVASAVVVPATEVRSLAPAAERATSRALDAAYPPDSPPPKA